MTARMVRLLYCFLYLLLIGAYAFGEESESGAGGGDGDDAPKVCLSCPAVRVFCMTTAEIAQRCGYGAGACAFPWLPDNRGCQVFLPQSACASLNFSNLQVVNNPQDYANGTSCNDLVSTKGGGSVVNDLVSKGSDPAVIASDCCLTGAHEFAHTQCFGDPHKSCAASNIDGALADIACCEVNADRFGQSCMWKVTEQNCGMPGTASLSCSDMCIRYFTGYLTWKLHECFCNVKGEITGKICDDCKKKCKAIRPSDLVAPPPNQILPKGCETAAASITQDTINDACDIYYSDTGARYCPKTVDPQGASAIGK